MAVSWRLIFDARYAARMNAHGMGIHPHKIEWEPHPDQLPLLDADRRTQRIDSLACAYRAALLQAEGEMRAELERWFQREVRRASVGSDSLGPMTLTEAARWARLHDKRGERFHERYIKTDIVPAYRPDPEKQPRLWVLCRPAMGRLRRFISASRRRRRPKRSRP